MYTLIIFLVIAILSIAFACSNKAYKHDLEVPFGIVGMVSAIISLTMLLILIVNNTDNRINSTLIQYNNYKSTIEEARKDPNKSIERAAIIKDVIDFNNKILQNKYDNTTQWDWWTPDTLANLQPIK